MDIVFSITVSVYFLKASNQEKADMSVNLHKLMALGNRGFWNFRRKKGCNVNPELLPIPATGENLGITVFFVFRIENMNRERLRKKRINSAIKTSRRVDVD